MTAQKFVEMARTGNQDTLEFLDRFLKAWDSVRSKKGKKSIYHRYLTIMGMGASIFICCTLVSIFLGLVMVLSEPLYLKSIGACTGGAGFIAFVTMIIHVVLVNDEFERFIRTITFIETKCGFGDFGLTNYRWQYRGKDLVSEIGVPLTEMCQSIASGQCTTFGRDEANRRREELARMYQDILVLTKNARRTAEGTILATDRDLPKDLGGFFK
jgi:hypothetical protein